MHGSGPGAQVGADRTTPARAWVPLAYAAPGQVNLARPVLAVGVAIFLLFVTWWAATGEADPYSSRLAARAAFVVWTSPLAAIGCVTFAAGRVLVSVRAVAALYGREHAQGVELAGFAGRFGWVPGRRRFLPGRVRLDVGVGGPPAMPMHHLGLTQPSSQLSVGADAPWDDGALPGIVAWLGEHGIETVVLRRVS